MIWLSVAFRNLFRNVRRTLAMLFTIAVGSGALFTFSGFICGVLNEFREGTIHAHYGHGQVYTKGYRGAVFENPIAHWMRQGPELALFLMDQKEVEHFFPRVSVSGILKSKQASISGYGQGIDGEKEQLFFTALNIEEGTDVGSDEQGILLGKGLASALGLHTNDPVTMVILSQQGIPREKQFKVSGVFHTGDAHFDNRVFRMHIKAAQSLLKTEKIESFAIGLKKFSDWDSLAAKIALRFPDLEPFAFNVLDKIYYQHSVDWLHAQFKVVQSIILGIVLLGIFNTFGSSILERKQEIGHLRANGESAWSIMRTILLEGSLLSLFGACLGMGISYLFLMAFVHKGLLMPPGPGQTRQFLVTFSFPFSILLKTLLYPFLSSLIASLFAALRVLKMTIAQSLRSY